MHCSPRWDSGFNFGSVTIKFLNFRTPENLNTNTLKFYHNVIPLNDANGNANNEDLDQTAPLGAV